MFLLNVLGTMLEGNQGDQIAPTLERNTESQNLQVCLSEIIRSCAYMVQYSDIRYDECATRVNEAR